MGMPNISFPYRNSKPSKEMDACNHCLKLNMDSYGQLGSPNKRGFGDIVSINEDGLTIWVLHLKVFRQSKHPIKLRIFPFYRSS